MWGVTNSIVLAEIAWAFLRNGKGGIELGAARSVIENMGRLGIIEVDNEIAWNAGKLRRKHYGRKLQLPYQDAVYFSTYIRERVEAPLHNRCSLLKDRSRYTSQRSEKCLS
jgi:hypothetical protein